MSELLKIDNARYGSVARGCCAVAAAIALAVWLALALGIPRPPRQGNPLILMAPATVLSTLLYAGAGFLAAGGASGRRAVRFSLTVMLACGAMIALVSLFFLRGRYPGFALPGVMPSKSVAWTPLDHMSPITSVSFLALGCAFAVDVGSAPRRRLRAQLSFWVALLFAAGYSMLFLAYLLGTPMFYGDRLFPPSATTCLAFMALWSSRATLSLPLAWPDALRPDPGTGHGAVALVVGFVLLLAGIVAAGTFYHRNMEDARLREVWARLSAIADLKAGEIALWHSERRIDASFFHENRAFGVIVKSFLRASPRERSRHILHVWLASVRNNRNYDGVFLLDRGGKDQLGYARNADQLPLPLVASAQEALRNRCITFADFYREREGGGIRLGIVVPIFDASPRRKGLAALVLRINPEKYLFPFIRIWPTESASAESLLVRREGNYAIFLNDLRFSRGAALNLRIPLDRVEVPAVMAVLGRTGNVSGMDYRGVPVLASLRAIPGSPWRLVARVDSDEVYRPLRERVRVTVALVFALLLSAACGVGIVWKQRNLTFYRKSEQDAKRSGERLQCLVNVLQYQPRDNQDLLDYALSEGLRLTASAYGYIYLYNEESRRFIPKSWSRGVMGECAVLTPPPEYDLDRTGIWGEVVRQRRPLLVNDFAAANPLKRGYPEGHVHLTRFLSIPIIEQGRIVAVAGVANSASDYGDSDVVQLSLLMAAVWKVAERKRSADELQQRNAEMERFTYAISHDLKSPLVTVSAFLGYLEADIRNADQERIGRDMGYIRAAVERMGLLLGELLELLRVGWVVSNPLWVDARDLVQEALRLVAGPISERGVGVTASVRRIMLFCDRPRLVEVFQNLVENAVKYMGDQAAPRIDIGAEEVGGETVFFVRDNGMGIDARYRENIFGLFNKLDARSDGSGLGLALVKRIVEMYGGRIWVESGGAGRGSCFRFTLPGALERRVDARDERRVGGEEPGSGVWGAMGTP
jgi:signal transduction histidine kinase